MAVPEQATQTGIAPIIARSREAYRRDLPALLKRHPGQWVAYSGDRRIGIGTSKTALYQECFGQGLKRGEFLVEVIEPEVPTSAEVLSDV